MNIIAFKNHSYNLRYVKLVQIGMREIDLCIDKSASKVAIMVTKFDATI